MSETHQAVCLRMVCVPSVCMLYFSKSFEICTYVTFYCVLWRSFMLMCAFGIYSLSLSFKMILLSRNVLFSLFAPLSPYVKINIYAISISSQ